MKQARTTLGKMYLKAHQLQINFLLHNYCKLSAVLHYLEPQLHSYKGTLVHSPSSWDLLSHFLHQPRFALAEHHDFPLQSTITSRLLFCIVRKLAMQLPVTHT